MITNYIEELESGDCFEFEQNKYLLTKDFKNNGNRLCSSLIDGSSRWLKGDTIVHKIHLFTMDLDNNVIAIKEATKPNVSY